MYIIVVFRSIGLLQLLSMGRSLPRRNIFIPIEVTNNTSTTNTPTEEEEEEEEQEQKNNK